MAECIPFRLPGDAIPAQPAAAVTGQTFVKVIAARLGGGANGLSTDVNNLIQIGPCTVSGEAALGVCKYDAPISSGIQPQITGVFKRGSGFVVPVVAGANITYGQEVQTDANGHAIPQTGSGHALGYALDSAASGAVAEIALY
jgi:hypothetical protein